jgi:hypothetical protein
MKVRVLKAAFIGGSRVKAGSVIDYDGKVPAWMEPVESGEPDQPKPRRGRPPKVEDAEVSEEV